MPGGGSLHNMMSAHGPDRETFDRASSAELKPQKIDDGLAFMFETRWPVTATGQAVTMRPSPARLRRRVAGSEPQLQAVTAPLRPHPSPATKNAGDSGDSGPAEPSEAPAPQGAAFAPDSLVLNRKLPLWYQVSQSLRASILGRTPGATLRLPTEEQLAAHYGVSVLTMRQALKELETEGLIEAGTGGAARSSNRAPAGCHRSGCSARSTRSSPSSRAN